ncbi:MAG: zinc D-Ala-D-Ala carboxypeptidase [Actinomycetota bacterium]|nr:zinc D-Ala-D-Ala carboxypeptidase [Actinomycetota bacterium]
MPNPRRTACALVLALVVVGSSAACAPARSPIADGTPTTTASATPSASAAPASPGGFDRAAFSIDDPASVWVVVNKLRPLNPISYAPKDLVTVPVAHDNPAVMRRDASAALVAMFAAGAAEGAGAMQVQSSYRSYPVQVQVYNGWVSSLGKTQADKQSARPGYSEHQTGLAVDISPVPLTCSLAACFGTTPQGEWLAANAWRFGYLLRYPADKTAITGYEYEPWHFRFIGVPLATELHTEGVETLEEFFGLPPAPDYLR